MHTATDTLLTLWEAGLGRAAQQRDSALLNAANPGVVAPRALDQRNAALIDLHVRLFGPAIDLLSHCPACATPVEFSGDGPALREAIAGPDTAATQHFEWQGHAIEFLLPDAEAVAIAVRQSHQRPDAFVTALLERCVIGCVRNGVAVPTRELPPPLLDALSRRMETLAPGASLSFALQCPQCATRWDAALDAGEVVWGRLQAAAERLLLDVDALARSYGWSEPEVLALSPQRRAAYLQMALA